VHAIRGIRIIFNTVAKFLFVCLFGRKEKTGASNCSRQKLRTGAAKFISICIYFYQ